MTTTVYWRGGVDADMSRDFRAPFDAHDDAIQALRKANRAMGEAIDAHDAAIQKAVDANRAALSLLRRLSGEDDRS